MENECRYLLCKKCDNLSRIEITEEDYGGVLSITCPECGMKCQAIVFRRENVNELLKNIVNTSLNSVKQCPEVVLLMSSMVKAGYKVKIGVNVDIEPIPIEQLPEPKVVAGEIEPGTFTEEDLALMREMKI